MTAQVTYLSQLQATQTRHQIAGGNFLGCVIGWKVNPTTRLDHARFSQIANTCGVPSSLIPNEVKPAQAFRKAIEKTRLFAQKQGLLLRYIGDLTTDDDQAIYVGLVEEKADLNQRA